MIFFGGKSSIGESLINFPVFTIKYVIVSIIFSFNIPFFVEIVRKNIDYNIEVKKMKNIKEKLRIKKAFSYILMILSGLLIGLLIYIKMNYKDVTFEQFIYSLMYAGGYKNQCYL